MAEGLIRSWCHEKRNMNYPCKSADLSCIDNMIIIRLISYTGINIKQTEAGDKLWNQDQNSLLSLNYHFEDQD